MLPLREAETAAGLISPAFNPDLLFFVISWINPNLIMTADPVSILIMVRDPNVFPPFRNPKPVYFPMARRLAYRGRGLVIRSPIMARLRGDDRRRMTILK
jgi:hypothetical protein